MEWLLRYLIFNHGYGMINTLKTNKSRCRSKTMSIKRYLFVLIGSIVLTVAAIQLIIVTAFKQHLSDEIVQKSRQMSNQIIEYAVKSIEPMTSPVGEEQTQTRVIKHKLQINPDGQVDSNDIEFVLKPGQMTPQHIELKQRLHPNC